MSGRALITRSKEVPATLRQTGSPSIATRTAVLGENMILGGSFFTGTDRPIFSAFSMESIAWSRSRDMVEFPAATIAWKPSWYHAALFGLAGKLAFLTWMLLKCTVRDSRSTCVFAVI